MAEPTSTELALLDDKTHNVLVPSVEMLGQIDGFHAVMIQTVTIDPYNESYEVKGKSDASGKPMRTLGATALKRLMAAAGIELVESDFNPAVPITAEGFAWRAVVRQKMPDGTYRQGIGNTEWDHSTWIQPILDAAAQKEASNNQQDKSKAYGLKQQAADLRKYRVPHTETRALNRALRGILATPPVYTLAQLSRPFSVPIVVDRPDLSNPGVVDILKSRARAAAGLMYGAPEPEVLPVLEAQTSRALPDGDSPPLPVEMIDEPVEDAGEAEVVEESAPEVEAEGEDFDAEFANAEPASDDPGAYVLTKGVYATLTLDQVEAKKPGYCSWIITSGRGTPDVKAACQRWLDAHKEG